VLELVRGPYRCRRRRHPRHFGSQLLRHPRMASSQISPAYSFATLRNPAGQPSRRPR
jgi:hypothetical protein